MNNRDLLVGCGLGAALTYLLDPATGGRRRALVRNKVTRVTRRSREALRGRARDLSNRVQGVAAEVRAARTDEPVDDVRLLERVRAELGRATTHPRAIDVIVANGEVSLRGPILASEVNGLITTVSAVRGVRSVVNQLEPHTSDEGIPSLQGGGRLSRSRVIPIPRRAMRNTVIGAAGLAAAGAYFATRAARSH